MTGDRGLDEAIARMMARGPKSEDADTEPGEKQQSHASAEARDHAEERRLQVVQSVAVESQEAEADAQKRELGFCCRFLVQATLPHSRPDSGVHEYIRRNGNLTITVNALSQYGLPYGRYPRQILATLCGEAVRTRSPEIHIGETFRFFVEHMMHRKYSAGKRGTATAIKDQLIRLARADIQADWRDEGKFASRRLSPINRTVVFWDPSDHKQIVDWQAHLTLSQEFYDELIARPIPVDLATLASFQSPMRMDIYTWMTYRFSYLSARTLVPWEGLHGQFGCGYPVTSLGMRNFRREFRKNLKSVHEKYPQARALPTQKGLQLDPSPPHVRCLPGGRR